MSRRCRDIKPDLWMNENLAEISIAARYLFPGLWCLADRDGRLEYRPKKIKAELYPYDDLDIISLIAELHGKKFISVYENEGSQYIQIKNFKKHQNPHPKEKSYGYPEPVNVCIYNGKEKKFNLIASRENIPDSLSSEFSFTSESSDSLSSEFSESSLENVTHSLSGCPDVKTESIPYKRINETMNKILLTKFKVTEDFKKLVKARYRDGFIEEDFAEVCRKQLAAWSSDTKMAQYLRPTTLFGTKMNNYLGTDSQTPERPMSQREKVNRAAKEAFVKGDLW